MATLRLTGKNRDDGNSDFEFGARRLVSSETTDRRMVRTQAALVQAGTSLFAEQGLHAVGVDDIIARAGLSKQTFYNHFNDKMALAKLIYSDIRKDFLGSLRGLNASVDDPALRLARSICFYVRKALDDPNRIRFLSQMMIQTIEPNDMVNRGLLQDLEAGLAAGRFVIRTLETGAAFVLGASEPLLHRVLACNDAGDAAILANEFVSLILRGLAVPPMEAELLAAQATQQVIRRASGGD